jgi:hypothetical protein
VDQETYRDAIARTWNDDTPEQYQPANAALGVVGEVREFYDGRHIGEAGDLIYYTTTLRRLLAFPVADDLDPFSFDEDEDVFEEMRFAADQIAEHTKKYVFHGEDFTHLIEAHTYKNLQYVAALFDRHGGSIEMVREHNVEKLRGRYPDGFEKGSGRD